MNQRDKIIEVLKDTSYESDFSTSVHIVDSHSFDGVADAILEALTEGNERPCRPIEITEKLNGKFELRQPAAFGETITNCDTEAEAQELQEFWRRGFNYAKLFYALAPDAQAIIAQKEAEIQEQAIDLLNSMAFTEKLKAERDTLRKDAEIVDFIQRTHTLHKSLEFLYVVDGYETTVIEDDDVIAASFHGATLRESISKAIAAQREVKP